MRAERPSHRRPVGRGSRGDTSGVGDGDRRSPWPASAAVAGAAVAVPVAVAVTLRPPLFQLDLLVDALEVVTLVVVLLLLGICQDLIGLPNPLEHLLSVLPGNLVQVALLVGMPLRCPLAVGLFDLQLRGHRWHAQELVVVGALLLSEQELGLLEFFVDALLAVPGEEPLELLDGVLLAIQGLQRLGAEEVGLDERVVAIGRLSHVFEDPGPILQPDPAFGALAVEGGQHDRIVLALLNHLVQDLLRLLELSAAEGCLELRVAATQLPKPFAERLCPGVVRVEGQGLLEEPLALLQGISPLRRICSRVVVAVQRLGAQDKGIYVAGICPQDLLGGVQDARVVLQFQVTPPHLQGHCRTTEESLCLQLCQHFQRVGGFTTRQCGIRSGQLPLSVVYEFRCVGQRCGVPARRRGERCAGGGEVAEGDLRRDEPRPDLRVLRVEGQGLLTDGDALVHLPQHEARRGDIAQQRGPSLGVVRWEEIQGTPILCECFSVGTLFVLRVARVFCLGRRVCSSGRSGRCASGSSTSGSSGCRRRRCGSSSSRWRRGGRSLGRGRLRHAAQLLLQQLLHVRTQTMLARQPERGLGLFSQLQPQLRLGLLVQSLFCDAPRSFQGLRCIRTGRLPISQCCLAYSAIRKVDARGRITCFQDRFAVKPDGLSVLLRLEGGVAQRFFGLGALWGASGAAVAFPGLRVAIRRTAYHAFWRGRLCRGSSVSRCRL
mmetsp:Transcript_22214/g.59331  ORF Transcript_22214/g.59331 Transcript_22214/m.59331 type:complete len:718 (-) Transcript_22214:141-2294(-)